MTIKVLKQFIYFTIILIIVIGITFIISLLISTPSVDDMQAAESKVRVEQVYLQQESVRYFYEKWSQEESSAISRSGSDTVIVKGESTEITDTSQGDIITIISSASDAINVSISVLQNLSLSVADGQPKYATNWKFGATVHTEIVSSTEIAYTVTADY